MDSTRCPFKFSFEAYETRHWFGLEAICSPIEGYKARRCVPNACNVRDVIVEIDVFTNHNAEVRVKGKIGLEFPTETMFVAIKAVGIDNYMQRAMVAVKQLITELCTGSDISNKDGEDDWGYTEFQEDQDTQLLAIGFRPQLLAIGFRPQLAIGFRPQLLAIEYPPQLVMAFRIKYLQSVGGIVCNKRGFCGFRPQPLAIEYQPLAIDIAEYLLPFHIKCHRERFVSIRHSIFLAWL
jgi:hypothetical protein